VQVGARTSDIEVRRIVLLWVPARSGE
jgi:hypothetical protein